MQDNAIDISDVVFGYQRSLDVLYHIDVSIHSSAITVVIGKSGSGKSTLLKLINGMVRPREGEVRLNGRTLDYENIHALRLQIGYVVQHVGLFPHMTIAENVSILGRIARNQRQQIDKRVRTLMDMVELPASYLNKYPHQLSGGEQQRIGLCRALMLNPPVVLMDEPFASLDHKTKHGIYTHLLDIQKREPRTIVMVTHNWEETMTLADRFIWVENGKVKAHGDKQDLMLLKDIYFAEAE